MQQHRAYAGSIGVRLLERISETVGPVFSADEALQVAQGLRISASHTYKLLHLLAASSYLRRMAKSLYVIESPLAGGGTPHSFAVATKLVKPSAISHWSALEHWGLVDQIPMVVTASTPKSVVTPEMRTPSTEDTHTKSRQTQRHAAWIVDGIRYEYTRIPPHDMFGIDQVWVDSRTRVPMFDRERALLDAFVHLRGFGAGGLGGQILSEHWGEIDVAKLSRYADRMGRERVSKRVGTAIDEVRRQAAPMAA